MVVSRSLTGRSHLRGVLVLRCPEPDYADPVHRLGVSGIVAPAGATMPDTPNRWTGSA